MEVKQILFKLFHLIGVLHYAYAIFYDVYFVFPEEVKFRKYSFGGKFIYLTFWDTNLQLIYFSIAFLNDFIGSNEVMIKDRPLIRRIKDYIFATLAFPLAFDVGVMFWSFFTIDRELVAPKAWDAIFPVWLNHFIHTDIMVFMAIEMVILHRHYPRIKHSLLGLFAFMLAYISWVHIIHEATGYWVYPILAAFNWAQRLGFHLFNISVPVTFYFIGKFINNWIWSEDRVKQHIQAARDGKIDNELAEN